jgi:hypothetical protein
LFRWQREKAIKFMNEIINDEAFIEREKPYCSEQLRQKYNLTERQQARIEVRLEKIFSYLVDKISAIKP